MFFRILIVATLIFTGWYTFHDTIIIQPSGILVNEDPIITPISDSIVSWQQNDYTITPRETYHIKARVLSKHHYLTGDETDLSHYDLFLGWKDMSDTDILSYFKISQSFRWVNFSWNNKMPLTLPTINLESCNYHIIAANKDILHNIKKIKVGNIIVLDGYLVDVTKGEGWYWKGSLSAPCIGPHGNGGHACKILWVTTVEVSP